MEPSSERSRSQVLRGRGVGSRVGTLIGVGWMVWGIRGLSKLPQILLGTLGLPATIYLLKGASRLIKQARSLPAPDEEARHAGRRIWFLFWVNFVVEIVLLNVAINLLAAPALRPYWIPAISLVVGLHFLPMATIYHVPSYWACGLAIIAGAAAVTLVGRQDESVMPLLVAVEGVFNALVLWSTAAWGIVTTDRLPSRVDG